MSSTQAKAKLKLEDSSLELSVILVPHTENSSKVRPRRVVGRLDLAVNADLLAT